MVVFKLFVIASIVMGAAHTITRERLFEPLRRRLGGKRTWLGYLVSCPYCASHWIAFVVLPLTGSYFVDVAPGLPLPGAVRWFLSAILVATVAAYLRVLFYLVDESQGFFRRAEELQNVELRDKTDGGDGRSASGRAPVLQAARDPEPRRGTAHEPNES